jgi:1-acyl-sn-glycerol-3-phosphate acyltransferase
MRALREAAVWTGIVLLTLLFGLPSIPAAFVPPRGEWFLLFARGWARAILRLAGITVSVRHGERFEPGRSFVIAANHESFCDILVLLANVPLSLRFLAKRSIFRVPVLGWSIAAAGFVPVDRGERRRSAAIMDAALKRLRGGRSLVIFPEETRTPDGELLPFKQGAALLALRSGLPLLPVGIGGTFRILPKGSRRITPGRVVLAAGSPIEVGGRRPSERRDLTRIAREQIGALREEARRALAER